LSEQTRDTRLLKELVGAILAIAAIVGLCRTIFSTGGPNAQYFGGPTGWMGVLPYGVMVLGVAAYLLLRDTM